MLTKPMCVVLLKNNNKVTKHSFILREKQNKTHI